MTRSRVGTLTLLRIAAGWPNCNLDLLLPFNHHDN